MKLPKKYIKKYGISAKAWRAYKASLKNRGKKKTVSGTPKKKRKVTAKRTATKQPKRKVTTMAKKKRKTSKAMGKPGRRKVSFMTNRTINAAVKGGMSAMGVILGLVMANKIPIIKDQAAWVKAVANIVLGSIGITMIKQPMGKNVAAGVVTAGALSFILPMMPEGTMAGGSRRLTKPELMSLRTGKPASVLGRPASITGQAVGRSGVRSALRSRY